MKERLEKPMIQGAAHNTSVAFATPQGFTKNYKDEKFSHIFLERSCVQSLLRCMGFAKLSATTGNVEIPEVTKKEADLLHTH